MSVPPEQNVSDETGRGVSSEGGLTVSVMQDNPQTGSTKILTREICFDEGHELAFFTLRRVHDGH